MGGTGCFDLLDRARHGTAVLCGVGSDGLDCCGFPRDGYLVFFLSFYIRLRTQSSTLLIQNF